MKRITRDRFLTEEEAEQYKKAYMEEENQMNYDDLFELSHHDLVNRLLDAEGCIAANDEEMQKMEAEKEAISKKLESNMRVVKRAYREKDWNAIYSPEYYLRCYEDHTREDLILEIMDLRITLRGMFHD